MVKDFNEKLQDDNKYLIEENMKLQLENKKLFNENIELNNFLFNLKDRIDELMKTSIKYKILADEKIKILEEENKTLKQEKRDLATSCLYHGLRSKSD